mmetsp:Transcript_17406/g.26425  ORF Transcript_17406/g.26425 Transcript_17406/m.26425 type:complete len:859 (+) Transcript_17406:232-2808(+)
MPKKKHVSITDDDIGRAVRDCLSKVKNDEVYMSHDLQAKDLDDIKSGKEKSKKIYRFLELVSSTLNITKKKEVKTFIANRLEGQSIVKKEIASFDSNNPSESENVNDLESAPEDNATKKRRRSSAGQKKQPKNNKRRRSSITFEENERNQFAAELKTEFEADKQKVMNLLDNSYKELFGKIAFCKWKKDPYRPVLILSPYSVPPNLRDTWLTMFENTKGDVKRMWYYTFWYGSPLEEGYTQSKRKDFILYEEGEKKGLHQLSEKIKSKLEKGKKLTRTEEQAVRGYEQLEAELKKDPSERRSENFQEVHESVQNLEETVSLPDEDSIESMDFNESEDDSALSDSDDSEDEGVTPVKDEEATPVKDEEVTPVKVKGGRKGKKPAVTKKKKIKPNKKAEKTTKVTKRGRKPAIKEECSDSSGGADLTGKQDVPIDDSEDEGLKRSKTISRKRGSKKNKKDKKPREENEEQESEPVKADRDFKIAGKKELKKKRMEEREAYKVCCVLFQTLTDELRNAIRKEDGKQCVKLMKKIKDNDVGKLTVPFMEETKLPILLKKTKPISDGIDKKVRKDLYDALKKVYENKKDDVPDGWRDSREKKPFDLIEKESGKEKEIIGNNHKGGEGESSKNAPNQDTIIDSSPNERKSDDTVTQPRIKQEIDRSESIGNSVPVVSGNIISTTPNVANSVPNSKIGKRKTSLTSLKSLLAKDAKPKEKVRDDMHGTKPSPIDEAIVKRLPEWLTAKLTEESSVERDNVRKLGLDFFNQVSEMFPETIESETAADSLERALHAWATRHESEPKWKKPYREKLHKVIGALAGKHKPGLLVEELARGKYDSAMDLIELSDEHLQASFEGNKALKSE